LLPWTNAEQQQKPDKPIKSMSARSTIGSFMKDQFRSDLRASKLTAPVLVVHGDNDAVVPIALGKRLYGLIQAPKHFVSVAGAGHNDLGARAVAAAKLFITEDRHPMAGRPNTG
jgi:pimeloyl-ACP methyl ester carboxylesterase